MAGLGSGLSSCAALDRFFGLEKAIFDREVLIIGGGAAGLCAAYELKKAGVPFRLFEASPRIGGRIYTLDNFDSEGHTAELGAEYFEESHKLIFDLCRELNLPVDEVEWDSSFERQISYVGGKILTSKDLAPRLHKLTTQLVRLKLGLVGDRNEVVHALNAHEFEKAADFDRQSMGDLLRGLGNQVDRDTLRLFASSCVAQFGASTEKLSALHLLNSIDLEAGPQKNFYRVRQGNQRLMRTIYERISGVLPDYFVRVDSPLISISEVAGFFNCQFRTPSGKRTYSGRYVIFAVPANQYKNIEGLDQLIDDRKKKSLQEVDLAAHSKVLLGYRQRFWQKKSDSLPAHRGVFVKEDLPAMTWDSSMGQEGQKGILSVLVGGDMATQIGAQAHEQFLRELTVFGRSFRSEYDNLHHVINWKTKAFTQGSFVSYRPGQFTTHHGLWSQSDYGGRLTYAGEHCHLSRYGTWVGALESGQKAAQEIIALQQATTPGVL